MNEKIKVKKDSSLASLGQVQMMELPLLPLKNMAVLPKSILPVVVGREFSMKAVELALKQNRMVIITAQKSVSVERPTMADLYEQGIRAIVLQVMRAPNGALKVLVEGVCRASITSFNDSGEHITVGYKDLASLPQEHSAELEAVWRELRDLYLAYTKINESASTDIVQSVKTVTDIDYAADTIAVHINNLSLEERQSVVALVDLKERMMKLCALLIKEIEIQQTEQRIRSHIQTQIEKNQKEYYLTEQIKAIQKELGREDFSGELEQLRTQVKKVHMSKEASQRAEKELQRLEQMPPFSAEAVVSRHYLDWLISLPWDKTTTDAVSIADAIKILHKSHAGLIKPKERIIEFLAAKKFSKNLYRSPIICLVGPPGVGKTSLARSIAESLGRKFVRISLGGVRDEAEIRGHRRTYIGALPGKIIHAMRKAETNNPVILLDEVDKMARDYSGDPASALLEVLDPEQNKQFSDHFLDVGYDISQVMFIATANMLENIPYALADRLEIIHLSGYTDAEKIEIARKFLIPKTLKEHGLLLRQFTLSDDLLKLMIEEYTREAGVRQLERIIAKLVRKSIQKLLESKDVKAVVLTKELLIEWLGHATHKKTLLSDVSRRIGLATGLAWTELGGDVMEIEVTVLPGKGNVLLTGQLGDVMQESAQAALSYTRSRAKELGLPNSFHASKDIHIHIPEGATPKDGPSAGITIGTALISALTKIPTKGNLAMTGEITLQGRVLPIGGLKEKLIAAKQYGCNTVLLPHENKNDFIDVLKEIEIGTLAVKFVKTMDEVLSEVLEKNPLSIEKQKKKSETVKKRRKSQTEQQRTL
jgi:ATP-dependent Lon protease